ncbi:hypothetical protein ACOACO_01415 [Nocardioides sp. CPCC 205120]|uniref:hypothetical protein n=1 Tax=Nocardioides sp. CPCC 205120 TaxID=3406462 RepID=UPI003B504987
MANYWLGVVVAMFALPIAYITFDAIAPAAILAVGVGIVAALMFGGSRSNA